MGTRKGRPSNTTRIKSQEPDRRRRRPDQDGAADFEHLTTTRQVSRRLGSAIARIPGALPSMFQGNAPAQLDPADTPNFPAGELRGMYSTVSGGKVSQTYWKPQWSTFGHPRGGGAHNGVDIYAPVGTPLVAVFDGEVSFHAAGSSDIGNRAWLAFNVGVTRFRLIYGHLSGFSGNNRKVHRGEVIGYSGCSGNADYAHDCLTPGKCGVASNHVHLILKNDSTGKDHDPTVALGWILRYHDDLREVPCIDVVPPIVKDHSLSETIHRLADGFRDSDPKLVSDARHLYLASLAILALNSKNIDLTAPEGERAKAMYVLLGQVVEDMDASKPPDQRENIRRFLLHVAWHESDRLRTRKQYQNGPARSLFQFECHRAKDELDFLISTNRLHLLTASAGATESELRTAASHLPVKPGYPAGNLVTELMEQNDEFAARLARLAFRRIPAAIPSDLNGHADFWYQHWKKTGGDPASLKKEFAASAAKLDKLLGLSASPNFYLLRLTSTHERQELAARRTRAEVLISIADSLPGISDCAVALIEQHESGGYDYYTRFAQHPYWPGVESGLTIGFGFDIGYRTAEELELRFAGLGPAAIARLGKALGVNGGQGARAKAKLKRFVRDLADITIVWDLARTVLREFDIPRYSDLTSKTFPIQELNPDQFGALVSLVFNRGTRLDGERRREMAAIHQALSSKRLGEVPQLLRSMKRLWPDVPSLQRRREDEARLFEGI